MHVLFTSIRNAGHFNPLVPLIRACVRRGHDVGVASAPDLAASVAKTGARFFPVDHPGDEGLRPLWARMRDMSSADVGPFVVREIFARACGGAALPKTRAAIEALRADVVVRESTEVAGAIAADACGVPHARMSITLAKFAAALHADARDVVDELRASVGLAPGVVDGRRTFTMFPRSFEDPTDPGPDDAMRFRATSRAAEPLPDFWPGRDGPIVYATLGSVAGGMKETLDAYRAILGAVDGMDARVLLTVGKELDPAQLGVAPAHVRVERWVPQDDVLPQARAIVQHGGSGTTLGALAHGVPQVVVPLFADQPENARRVAELGLGLSSPPTTDAIRAALSRVVGDDRFRARAGDLRREVAAMPTDDDAVDALAAIAR